MNLNIFLALEPDALLLPEVSPLKLESRGLK